MARSLPVENLLGQNVGSIINYLQWWLKLPNGELLVAVNHNQLRTMASETVNPIDWSHPPPSWAVPPEHLVHSRDSAGLSATSAGLERATAAYEATTLAMRHRSKRNWQSVAILPSVCHLQLITTLKIAADCCQQCQYNLTKPNLT